MTQDNSPVYFLVVDEKSTGPFSLEEILSHPQLTPDTLVWKPGIDNWLAAKNFPELEPAFKVKYEEIVQPEPPQQPPFHNPHAQGQPFQEPPYQNPPNFNNPNSDRFADNPQYQTHHTYHNRNHYDYQREYNPGYDRRQNQYGRDPYRPSFRTNWLPWAIVATIVSFFTSCVGAIFGIIGIVQANKANTCYARGFDQEGDAANSNAKVMTIIGLIFAGLGILAAIFFGGLMNSIYNLSYL